MDKEKEYTQEELTEKLQAVRIAAGMLEATLQVAFHFLEDLTGTLNAVDDLDGGLTELKGDDQERGGHYGEYVRKVDELEDVEHD